MLVYFLPNLLSLICILSFFFEPLKATSSIDTESLCCCQPANPMKFTQINISVLNGKFVLKQKEFSLTTWRSVKPVRGSLPSSEPIKRVLMRGEWKAAVDPPLAFDTMHCHLIKSWWGSVVFQDSCETHVLLCGCKVAMGALPGVAGTSWTWHHSLALDGDNGLPFSCSHDMLCHFKLLCNGLYRLSWIVQ